MEGAELSLWCRLVCDEVAELSEDIACDNHECFVRRFCAEKAEACLCCIGLYGLAIYNDFYKAEPYFVAYIVSCNGNKLEDNVNICFCGHKEAFCEDSDLKHEFLFDDDIGRGKIVY